MCPYTKKDFKNLTKNYRLIRFPILSKVFERFTLWKRNCSQNVSLVLFSGIPVLLNFYQLLMRITGSDYNPLFDIKGTLLDTSKAFDKVWPKSYGTAGKLLKLLQNYLTDPKQRVVLNEYTSSWENIWAGGCKIYLGSFLFLTQVIYLKEIPSSKSLTLKIGAVPKQNLLTTNSNSVTTCKFFPDDITFFLKAKDE